MRRLVRWPRRIFHLKRPWKRLENSIRGAVRAHESGFEGVDFDTRCTADGVVVASHDSDPGRWDEFRDRRGRIVRTPIEDMPWRKVRRLRTRDGFRIRRIETLLRICGRLGLVAVIEPKTRAAGTLQVWDHIVKAAEAVGCHLAAYALRSHHGEETMRNAHRAGVEWTRVINK